MRYLQLLLLFFLASSYSQQTDLQRPQYHALPPTNWMSDPCGPIYFQNNYHLFFQYNPGGAVYGNISWGHMESTDMVHWKWENVAMSPGENIEDFDHEGCLPGSAQLDTDGTPTIIYTGIRSNIEKETQLIATASNSNITSWEKSTQNPVIDHPPRDYFLPNEISGFRDPSFYYDSEENVWRMFIGSGLRGVGGMILQYESNSLYGPWTFINSLITGDISYGDMWENPDFFELPSSIGSKWVLLFGNANEQKNHYLVGQYNRSNKTFIPDGEPSLLDGGNFYAGKTALDKNGNRYLFGWSPEDRSEADYTAAGWAGVQTIPRKLQLSEDGTSLLFFPLSLASIEPEDANKGRQIRIKMKYYTSSPSNLKVIVLSSRTSGEQTTILYDYRQQTLEVNRRLSSLNTQANSSIQSIEYPYDGNSFVLDILVDNSIIEVCLNNAVCVTSRVYPTAEDADEVQLYSVPGSTIIQNFKRVEGIYA